MKKETIIFLHGIVGNKNAFKKEIETLKGHFHCIAYDFYDPKDLGVEGWLSLDLLLEQLYTKFYESGIKKAHLCAMSFGCIVAMAFARRYPDMVTSMTFVGGYCGNVRSSFYWNLTQVLKEKHQFEYEAWLKQYARLLNPNIEVIGEDSEAIFLTHALQVHPDVLDQAMRLQLEFDSKTTLSKIETPILWVMGEYDQLYKSTLTHLRQYIPHVEYKEIKHAGHVAHIHQPDEFMSLFQSFLRKETATGTLLRA